MRYDDPNFNEGPRDETGLTIYTRVVVSHENEGDIRDVYPPEERPPRPSDVPFAGPLPECRQQ
jgi:hypothetical protein